MKLLFDENLPRRLISLVEAALPGSKHVGEIGLLSADDDAVWTYARENGFTIVSKDSDFETLLYLRGHPPKVIRLGVGNLTRSELEVLIKRRLEEIIEFEGDKQLGLLVIRA